MQPRLSECNAQCTNCRRQRRVSAQYSDTWYVICLRLIIGYVQSRDKFLFHHCPSKISMHTASQPPSVGWPACLHRQHASRQGRKNNQKQEQDRPLNYAHDEGPLAPSDLPARQTSLTGEPCSEAGTRENLTAVKRGWDHTSPHQPTRFLSRDNMHVRA